MTYAGAGGIGRDILEKLAATGALQPRTLPPSAPLLATRAAITALVNEWSDSAFQAIAADNLLLDRPLDTRRQDVTALHQSLGTCAPDGDIDAKTGCAGRSSSRARRAGCGSPLRWLQPGRHGRIPLIRGGRRCRLRPPLSPTAGVGKRGLGDDLEPLLAA